MTNYKTILQIVLYIYIIPSRCVYNMEINAYTYTMFVYALTDLKDIQVNIYYL